MAFLLLLHQKMKLQRKENQLMLEQMQYMSKVDRAKNKVNKRQKYFDKLKKQLERQANAYKNNANIFFSQAAGLGTNSVNLSNPYATNGAAMNLLQNMSKEEIADILSKASNGQCSLDLKNETILNLLRTGVTQAPYDTKDSDGNEIKKGDIVNSWTGKKVDLQGADPQAINQAATILQQMANSKVTDIQTKANQAKLTYENNVSIWLEANMEELEAREEWEMDLLAEEQSDMEAEKASIDAQLELVKQEKQSIEQHLGQAIQDAAPKFGLA